MCIKCNYLRFWLKSELKWNKFVFEGDHLQYDMYSSKPVEHPWRITISKKLFWAAMYGNISSSCILRVCQDSEQPPDEMLLISAFKHKICPWSHTTAHAIKARVGRGGFWKTSITLRMEECGYCSQYTHLIHKNTARNASVNRLCKKSGKKAVLTWVQMRFGSEIANILALFFNSTYSQRSWHEMQGML